MGTFAFGMGKIHRSTNKSGVEAISIPVRLSKPALAEAMVDLEITGAKSNLEDYGFGKLYTLGGDGAAVLSAFEKTLVTLTFPAGTVLQVPTFTVVDNIIPDADRVVKAQLKNPAAGHRIFASNTLVIKLDDNVRSAFVNVTDPPGGNPVVADGTDQRLNLQSILDYCEAQGYTKLVLYFPVNAQAYCFAQNPGATGHSVIWPMDTTSITLVGGNDPWANPNGLQSIIKALCDDQDYTKLFRMFSASSYNLANTFAARNMVWDGNIYEAHQTVYEHSGMWCTMPTNNPRYECIRGQHTMSDLLYPGDSDVFKAYRIIGIDNGRGTITPTGCGNNPCELKDIVTHGPNQGWIKGGGVHCEMDHIGVPNLYRMSDMELNGGMLLTGMFGLLGTGNIGEYNNIKVLAEPNYTTHLSLNGGQLDGIGTFNNCELENSSYRGNLICAQWKLLTFNGGIIRSVPDPHEGPYVPYMLGSLGMSFYASYVLTGVISKAGSTITIAKDGINLFVGNRIRISNITQAGWSNLNGEWTIGIRASANSFSFDCGNAADWGLFSDANARLLPIPHDGSDHIFNNVTFEASGAQGADVMTYGLLLSNDRSEMVTVTLNGCIFAPSLHGACSFWGDSYGTPILVLNNCVFNCKPALITTANPPAYTWQTAMLNLRGLNQNTVLSQGEFNVTVKGSETVWGPDMTYFAAFPLSVQSTGATGRDSVLKFGRGLPVTPVAKSKIWYPGTAVHPRGYSFYCEDARHPTEMIYNAGTVTVTKTNHGLLANDRIMFDRIAAAIWVELSPDAAVPLLTVASVPDEDHFTFSVTLSGPPTNYSNYTTDNGVFWKHPGCRVIQGDSDSYNPVTSKPSGFTGDRFIVPTTPETWYYCRSTGKDGYAVWEAE